MTEEKMTNCPKCGKPILNGGVFTAPTRFNIRCPWCQSRLQITVHSKLVSKIRDQADG
jgi:endogenous inhibitor of DNA gyrase (YacG/DUF329 family)